MGKQSKASRRQIAPKPPKPRGKAASAADRASANIPAEMGRDQLLTLVKIEMGRAVFPGVLVYASNGGYLDPPPARDARNHRIFLRRHYTQFLRYLRERRSPNTTAMRHVSGC